MFPLRFVINKGFSLLAPPPDTTPTKLKCGGVSVLFITAVPNVSQTLSLELPPCVLLLQRECCLLVLNTVTSTPQWIRQPKPRGCVFVFVCKYELGRFRATQPPNLRSCLFRYFGFLTSPHATPTRSGAPS